ncbi:MAG: NUDIX hydrolase [Planctomycetota bacterium]
MAHEVARRIVHEGPVFAVEVQESVDSDGRPVRRDVVRHKGAVAIVPMLDDGRLVLIRNFRVAVDQTLWEIPAGGLERGEDPQLAAGRELEEETGYKAGRLDLLGTFYTTPGFADELMHVYVARDLTSVGQRLEPGEMIEVEPVAADDVFRMIDDGTIQDAKTIASCLMWDRRRAELAHA